MPWKCLLADPSRPTICQPARRSGGPDPEWVAAPAGASRREHLELAPNPGNENSDHDDRNAIGGDRPGRARGEWVPSLWSLPGGVQGGRRVQALARKDRDRGGAPFVLPAHNEPPPAARE